MVKTLREKNGSEHFRAVFWQPRLPSPWLNLATFSRALDGQTDKGKAVSMVERLLCNAGY